MTKQRVINRIMALATVFTLVFAALGWQHFSADQAEAQHVPAFEESYLLGLANQLKATYSVDQLTTMATAGEGCFDGYPICIDGRFLAYWQEHGGLAQNGFPLDKPFEERLPGVPEKVYLQYFERARFEHHPKNKPPFDILLGQLGRSEYDRGKVLHVADFVVACQETFVQGNSDPTSLIKFLDTFYDSRLGFVGEQTQGNGTLNVPAERLFYGNLAGVKPAGSGTVVPIRTVGGEYGVGVFYSANGNIVMPQGGRYVNLDRTLNVNVLLRGCR